VALRESSTGLRSGGGPEIRQQSWHGAAERLQWRASEGQDLPPLGMPSPRCAQRRGFRAGAPVRELRRSSHRPVPALRQLRHPRTRRQSRLRLPQMEHGHGVPYLQVYEVAPTKHRRCGRRGNLLSGRDIQLVRHLRNAEMGGHRQWRLTADQLQTYPSTLDSNHLAGRSVSAVCLFRWGTPVRVESAAQKRLNRCLTASPTVSRNAQACVVQKQMFLSQSQHSNKCVERSV